jgi:hypothetical protein
LPAERALSSPREIAVAPGRFCPARQADFSRRRCPHRRPAWFRAAGAGYQTSMDDDERRSDTKETHGSEGPAEDASNQQGEEAPAPLSGDGGGEPQGGGEGGRPGNPGGAGEHSQATGHPQNAG